MRRRLIGATGLVLIATLVAVLLGMYQKVFTPVTEVTVMSDRAGLLLDKGAAVRVSGLPVGEVRSVRQADSGQVAITVALDPDDASRIPDNVTASIKATTVFGAKFVDLEVPVTERGRRVRAIKAGAVVQSGAVTVEANDTFQHSIELIQAVDPAKLNTTLSNVAAALDGRGAALGNYLDQVNSYLVSFNRHLPQLEADLEVVDDVLRTYTAAAPHLIDSADQAGVTSVTLDSNLATFQAMLLDLVNTSGDVDGLLTEVEQPLRRTLEEFTPVSDLLHTFAPGLGCFLGGTAHMVDVVASGLGRVDPGIQGKAGFFPGQVSYDPELNKPKLVTGVGPVCYPLPSLSDPVPPHVRFDDGTKEVYDGVGPVVDPGTLNDPYGRPHGTATTVATSGDPSYRGFLHYLFGEQAGRYLVNAIGGGEE